MFHPGKDNGRLFHDQIILYGFDPLDVPCDLICFISGLSRINEAAQLNGALVSFDTDLERLKKIISCKQRFYLGRDDRIVNVFTWTCLFGCRCTGEKGGDQHKKHKIAKAHDLPGIEARVSEKTLEGVLQHRPENRLSIRDNRCQE